MCQFFGKGLLASNVTWTLCILIAIQSHTKVSIKYYYYIVVVAGRQLSICLRELVANARQNMVPALSKV